MLWDEEDVFGSLMRNLKITGFLHEKNFKNRLRTSCFLLLMIVVTLFYTMNLFISSEAEKHLAKTIEAIPSFIQVVVKAGTFYIYHKEFQIIAKNRQKFWRLDLMGTPLETELKKIRKICSHAFTAYSCIICVAFLAIVINGTVFKEMPFPCWLPEGNKWRIGMTTFQLLLLPYLMFTVTSFDFMFTAAFLEVFFQFRLLNTAFSKTQTIRDIKKCQAHQNLLFGHFKTLNRTFTYFLLVQYLLTISLSCMLITISMDEHQNFGNKLKSAVHFLAEVVQMAFFCLGPSLICDESENTLISIWKCSWYQKPQHFQKYVLYIMTMSNSKLSIKAGGLIEITPQLFLNVFKTTFSVYTLITATNEF